MPHASAHYKTWRNEKDAGIKSTLAAKISCHFSMNPNVLLNNLGQNKPASSEMKNGGDQRGHENGHRAGKWLL